MIFEAMESPILDQHMKEMYKNYSLEERKGSVTSGSKPCNIGSGQAEPAWPPADCMSRIL